MPQNTTPVPDRTIHRKSLAPAIRAGKRKGRYLVELPDKLPGPRLVLVRSYATPDKADKARSPIYLNLPAPPADP